MLKSPNRKSKQMKRRKRISKQFTRDKKINTDIINSDFTQEQQNSMKSLLVQSEGKSSYSGIDMHLNTNTNDKDNHFTMNNLINDDLDINMSAFDQKQVAVAQIQYINTDKEERQSITDYFIHQLILKHDRDEQLKQFNLKNMRTALCKDYSLSITSLNNLFGKFHDYHHIEMKKSNLQMSGALWRTTMLDDYDLGVFKFLFDQKTLINITKIHKNLFDKIEYDMKHTENIIQTMNNTMLNQTSNNTSNIVQSITIQNFPISDRKSETDCRLIIDTFLKQLCAVSNVQFRTELLIKHDTLPINQYDYVFYQNRRIIGAFEAKTPLTLKCDSIVQGIIQLFGLIALNQAHIRMPVFNIISDGTKFIFIKLDKNGLYCQTMVDNENNIQVWDRFKDGIDLVAAQTLLLFDNCPDALSPFE
ncbi:unnamed protein product [Didymodactylos carnosus]|uniref:Uncharacterized protein n=1 Tax=Didymodactylos carnosus TaxID=1234261 RepID=A0A814BCW5_9BILA|nr:unnamed protein product [Didymodactylos carnosus]CAF3705935.1 unnamed protein product [Didymodactylos carnosus]